MAPPVRDDTDEEDEDISFVREVVSPEKPMQSLRRARLPAGISTLAGSSNKRLYSEKREAEENQLNQLLVEAGFDPAEFNLSGKRDLAATLTESSKEENAREKRDEQMRQFQLEAKLNDEQMQEVFGHATHVGSDGPKTKPKEKQPSFSDGPSTKEGSQSARGGSQPKKGGSQLTKEGSQSNKGGSQSSTMKSQLSKGLPAQDAKVAKTEDQVTTSESEDEQVKRPPSRGGAFRRFVSDDDSNDDVKTKIVIPLTETPSVSGPTAQWSGTANNQDCTDDGVDAKFLAGYQTGFVQSKPRFNAANQTKMTTFDFFKSKNKRAGGAKESQETESQNVDRGNGDGQGEGEGNATIVDDEEDESASGYGQLRRGSADHPTRWRGETPCQSRRPVSSAVLDDGLRESGRRRRQYLRRHAENEFSPVQQYHQIR